MHEYQYLIGGALSLSVSTYVLLKRPKTLALKSLVLFGLVMSVWEVSTYFYRTAPNSIAAVSFFKILILTSHLGFPIYLLTILNVRERRNNNVLFLVLIPVIFQVAVMSQPDYIVNYQFFENELGWVYEVQSYKPSLIIVSIIFLGYLLGIVIALSSLIRKTKFPLLKRKYVLLLVSFVSFQVIGTTLTNALHATGHLDRSLQVGGIMQFLTFLWIWFALSLKEREMPISLMEAEDFSQIYSSFLTVYYNSIVGSQLGEEAFRFAEFIRESKIEEQVSLEENRIAFKEKENLDLAQLINNNLLLFARDGADGEISDQYLRVLNAADRRLGWRFDEVVRKNEDFLKRSDLIYGISHGGLLGEIDDDSSLEDLDDTDACLRIYKRILLPIIDRIQGNAKFKEKLSEYHITQALKISDYCEISINGVRARLLKVPKDERVPIAIERFNSVLSVVYEELLTEPDADVESILEKLMLVLTLNKDRAIALGVYPTLLGTLATKIPKAQIHELYSDFLEELVEERTRELREAQERLLKSHRLAAIGEAAAMVGHDLRNPLQAIVNTLYLAQKKLKSSPSKDLEDLLETVSEQVEYMNKIVFDLQDYARPVKPKLTETNLHQLLNETLSTVRIPEDIKVSVEIEEDTDFPKLMVDTQLMKRVLINLTMNAVQAMPQGGQLRIEASRKGETALVSFRDTGVGIPEENLKKIFQPLFTTKAKGQGLGLAVCKRLVEAHEGKISVESKDGSSSAFTIEIPFRPETDSEKNLTHLPQAAQGLSAGI